MKSLNGSFVVIAALALSLFGCDKNAPVVVLDTKDASVAACCTDDAALPVEVVDAGVTGTVVEPKPLVAPNAAPPAGDPPKAVSTTAVTAPVTVIPAATTKK